MSGYRYRGRHRKPTTAGKTVARVAVAGLVSLPLGTAAQGTAQAADALDIIASCESGNRNIENGSSSASGYWQIIDGTWRGAGGTQFAPRAIQASKAEQRIVAERIAARAGSFRDWNPSKGCWGGKVGSAGVPSASSPTPRVTKPTKPATPRAAGGDTGRATDGSGSYICDAGHLHFDACDPDSIGERVAYPLFDRHTEQLPAVAAATSGPDYVVKPGDTLSGIAVAHGKHWRKVAEDNRDVVANPDLIFPGQHLDV
jgi:resuscitation-promoting factor RpfA